MCGAKLKTKSDITLPINIGDTLLAGKFKNSRLLVKTITKNEKGEVLINGKQLLKMRIMNEDPRMSLQTKFENQLSTKTMSNLQNFQTRLAREGIYVATAAQLTLSQMETWVDETFGVGLVIDTLIAAIHAQKMRGPHRAEYGKIMNQLSKLRKLAKDVGYKEADTTATITTAMDIKKGVGHGNLSVDQFVMEINKLRKSTKAWYQWIGEANGHHVELKGFGTGIQIMRVDNLKSTGPMDAPVSKFQAFLRQAVS